MFRGLPAVLYIYLVLPGIILPQVPHSEEQNAGSCKAILDQAEELSKSENTGILKRALSLYIEASECLGPAPTQMKASTLVKISRMQLLLNDYSHALDSLDRALKTLQQLGEQNAEVRTTAAKVIGNRGYARKMLGQMDAALSEFKEALNRFEELGDIRYEAYTLEQIGLVYSLRGEPANALSSYTHALKLRKQIGPGDRINQQQTAAIFDLEGRVYEQLNDFDDAMASFRQALWLARKSQYYEFVALTLNDIGFLKLRQNRPSVAESYHQQALRILQEHGAEAKPVAETQALLADALTAQGKYDSALRNYHQALALQEEAEDVIGQAQTHFSLGMLESSARHWPQAQEWFTSAARLYGNSNSGPGESNARFRNATALAAQGDEAAARQQVEKAIELAENVWGETPTPDLKTSYFVTVEQMYRFEIGLLLHSGGTISESRQLEAFTLLQRAQTRTLLDALGAKMRANPRVGAFANIVSANEVKQRIVDPDSALIQFYLAEPLSYGWVITQTGISFIKLPSARVLESDVRVVLQFGMAGEWTAAQQVALNRFRRRLAPVFDAARKKRWIVVPDGALHFFPFTILTSGRQYRLPAETVKVPSASAIDAIRHASKSTAPAYALAIFADPVFDDLDKRVGHTARVDGSSPAKPKRSPTESNSYLPRLRYSSTEADDISQLFPRGQWRSFREFGATREAASGNALQDFRIVHFATHSLPDERHPEFSKIVLSRVTDDGTPRNGDLLAKDIYQMNLSADLVVLSSCRSAVGKQQPGEGPMSLSRAFLFAGTRAVVASLWEVNDEATADLMRRFYGHLVKENLPPSTALSLAQTEFRHHKDRRLHNPYYWAGFELYGEWTAH